jgi:hypothetical protein
MWSERFVYKENYFGQNVSFSLKNFSFQHRPLEKHFKKKFKMFKLVVLSCLLSVAFAGVVHQPITYAQVKSVVEPHYSVVETPTISQVGAVVKSIPTAHSYQSQTQYHSKSVVEPIYAHGVEKKYISTPVVKSVVEHVPVAKTVVAAPIVAKAVYAEPIVQKAVYAEAPVAYTSYAAAPVVKAAYAAAPAYASYAAPYAASYAAYPSAHSYSALPYAHHY